MMAEFDTLMNNVRTVADLVLAVATMRSIIAREEAKYDAIRANLVSQRNHIRNQMDNVMEEYEQKRRAVQEELRALHEEHKQKRRALQEEYEALEEEEQKLRELEEDAKEEAEKANN